MQKYTEDYSNLSDSDLVSTYNAVMANAYIGNECALEDEMAKRGLSGDWADNGGVEYFG
jgi:hypothetical protein